jgi:hypothetical protein
VQVRIAFIILLPTVHSFLRPLLPDARIISPPIANTAGIFARLCPILKIGVTIAGENALLDARSERFRPEGMIEIVPAVKDRDGNC